jgi:hypothetical protein
MADQDDKQEEKSKADPKWEKREFRINQEMKKVIGLGVKAAEAELETLRRKLKRLTYGG